MRKILCITFAMTILIFAFTGCSNFNAKTHSSQMNLECKENSSCGTYNFKFSAQDKQEVQTIDLSEDCAILIKYSSSVKRGKVSISLEDEEGTVIYNDSGKRFSFNESFSLESGLYKITLDYDNAEKGNIEMEIYSDSYFEYSNGKSVKSDMHDS